MPFDELSVLQASVTKTDTFQSAAVDLSAAGSGRDGLMARLIVTSYSNASGNATITPTIEHSNSSGSGYTTLTTGEVLTTSTTAGTSLQYLPVNTTKRYVRLVLTFSSTTGTPTATYSGDLGLNYARP